MNRTTESILSNFDIMREKAFMEAEPSIDTDTLAVTSDANTDTEAVKRLNNLFAWISDHATDEDLTTFINSNNIFQEEFEDPSLISAEKLDDLEFAAKNWISEHIASDDIPGLADKGIDLESEKLTESSDISEIYKTYTIRVDNLIKEARDVFYKEAVDENNAEATFENFIYDITKIADGYTSADHDMDESENLTEDVVPASVLDFKHTELKKVQDNISLIAGLKAEEPSNELYTKLMDAYDKVQKALEDVIEEDPVGTVVSDTPAETPPEEPTEEPDTAPEESAEEIIDEPVDSEEEI